MPTRTQLVSAINALRGRTPTTPIRDTELADMLESWLNYFDNNGEIMPETFQSQLTDILNTYDGHVATFQQNIEAATIQQELATEAANLAEAKRHATEALKNAAQSLLDNALAVANPQGEWSASNVPNLTAIPVAGPNGTYFDITVSGIAPFSGSNFAGGATNLEVGGRLIKKDETQWFYQGPSTAAIANLNGTKILDSGNIPGVLIPELQYQHPRGESEMAGNSNFSGATVARFGVWEQTSSAVVFNRARVYASIIGTGGTGIVTARAYKSSTFQLNPANMTLLAEKVFAPGEFNTIGSQAQTIDFGNTICRAKLGEYVYIILSVDVVSRLRLNSWNANTASVPVRHGFLYDAETANPWGTPMIMSNGTTFCQAGIELVCINPSSQEKYAYDQAKLKGDRMSVNQETGKLGGVYVPKIPVDPTRGNLEIIGNGNFMTTSGSASYFGFGWYEEATEALAVNKMDVSISAKVDSLITMRIYSGKVLDAGGVATANQKLLHSMEFAPGTFNKIDGAIIKIDLGKRIHIDQGEFYYVLFHSSDPTSLVCRRWSAQSGSAPFRHAFLYLSAAGGDVDPWNKTWARSSVGSGFWGTSLRLYNYEPDPDALLPSANGTIDGIYSPEVQYIHPRGISEMQGDSSFQAVGYYGVGWAQPIEKNTVFNKLDLPVYVQKSKGMVNIRLYKGAAVNNAPDAMVLIHSQDIPVSEFNTVSNGSIFQTVRFDTPLLLKKDDWLHVYCFCTEDNTVAIRRFVTAGENPSRLRFKFKQSATAWDVAWGTSSGTNYATAIKLSLVSNSTEGRLKALETENPRLVIPSVVYAVVGFQFSIYYDAIILGKDAGLQSPSNFSVVINCEKGVVKERYWRIEPTEAGTYPMTIQVYDLRFNLVAQKVITLVVSAAAKPATQKYLIEEGDSTVADGNNRVAMNENFGLIATGVTPLFLGTAGAAPIKSEAFGGSTILGHISQTMGTSAGSRTNALWNPNTNALDVAYYKNTVLGHAGNIDLVSIQLLINDQRGALKSEAEQQVILGRVKTLVDAWLADPTVKVIVQLPLSDVNVMYSGEQKMNYRRNMWRIKELLMQTFDEFAYSPRVYLGQVGIAVDRYFAYQVSAAAAGRRYTEIEYTHVDNVHPRDRGYKEAGDAKFAQNLALLQ